MQVYCKGSLGPSITVHNNGQVETSMQGYNKDSVGPIIKVRISG
jgi:hypothetical protein